MSQVKPDCYCLGGNRAHYSEAKYQSLQRTYEQARDEAKHLYGECLMLADVLRDAFEVVKTIEGEDSDECDKLQGLRMSIEYALAAYDERRIDTANAKLSGGGAFPPSA
jgi:thioredoxin-like negative regulator of GroEL